MTTKTADHKPASQGAEFDSCRYNLEAAFSDMGGARKALEALSQAGIEGQHISLRGAGADEAADDSPEAAANAGPDARLFEYWGTSVVPWMALGTLVGAAFAIPIGLLAMRAFDTEVTATAIALFAIAGGVGGGIVAFLVSTFYLISAQEQAWELSFHDTSGGIAILGIHSNERRDIDAARRILEKHHTIGLRQSEGGVSPASASAMQG